MISRSTSGVLLALTAAFQIGFGSAQSAAGTAGSLPHSKGVRSQMADSSADGRFYACATQQGRVVFGLTESQAVLRTFYVCEPQAIALTADGRFLAVAGKGGGSPAAIHVWDLKGGSLLASFRTVVTNDSLLKFSPNGEFLADTIPQGVEVWAVQRGERISIHPVVGKVAYLGFLDNQTVIIIREDGKVESFTMQ